MLPMFLRNRETLNRTLQGIVLVGCLLFVLPAYAIDLSNISVQDTLVNVANQVPMLMKLATALAYVLGMIFVVMSVIKLRHTGEMRTMMSQEHGLAGPLIMMAVGAMLLYIPTSVQVGLSTFWSDPNPYGYLQQQDQWAQFINDCFIIVQLVGVIAFIRGLIIWTHLGSHGGGQGNFARGLTHVIGGILCINIYQFIQVIMNTLGIQT